LLPSAAPFSSTLQIMMEIFGIGTQGDLGTNIMLISSLYKGLD
jgi:hypothetical protein